MDNEQGEHLQEPSRRYWLQFLLQSFRIKKVVPYIKPNSTLLDLGCGTDAALLKLLSPRLKAGIGIDRNTVPWTAGNIRVQACDLDLFPIPYPAESFDYVTMLAVLEHTNHCEQIFHEVWRVLKEGGQLVLTTPTWAAKPVLEFLSLQLKLIDPAHILEHKTYFWKRELLALLAQAYFRQVKHSYFQFPFNNFISAQKLFHNDLSAGLE